MTSENCAFEVASVRAILQGHRRLPPSDFIYASGLFDYLDNRIGKLVLKRMIAATVREPTETDFECSDGDTDALHG